MTEQQDAEEPTAATLPAAQELDIPADRSLSKSEAEKANARWHAAYQAALDTAEDLRSQLANVLRDKQLSEERGETDRNRLFKNTRIAMLGEKVLAELAVMMPDSEIHPQSQPGWDNSLALGYTNDHATFEVVFEEDNDDKVSLRVTPDDKNRRPIQVEISWGGLTVNAVLLIRGHLGLPDEDDELPQAVRSKLRRAEPTTREEIADKLANAAMHRFGGGGLLGWMLMSGHTGDSTCPVCGGQGQK